MTGHFSRNLSRDDWKVIHRVIRHDEDWHFHPSCSPVHNSINARAALWAKINEHAVNGRVGRVTAGMDCDCTQYRYEAVIDVPKGAMVAIREEESWYDSSDGYAQRWYRSPLESVQRYRSRDLALEAYEDGHPGTVYPGTLEVEQA